MNIGIGTEREGNFLPKCVNTLFRRRYLEGPEFEPIQPRQLQGGPRLSLGTVIPGVHTAESPAAPIISN
jgi:hypothetical protein